MLTGPNVILTLKIAVAAVTVILAASLICLLRGRYRLHGRLNIVFFILTVAAAESAIGLAILVVLFRNLSTINVEELDHLKG